MRTERWTLIAFILVATLGTAQAGNVWYQTRGGSSGSYENASWNDLQSAITSAQGGSATTGVVKISGDITRTNAAWGQLTVSAGGVVAISGGWVWNAGIEPFSQTSTSVLDAASVPLASNIRVLAVGATNVTLSRLGITGGNIASGDGGGIYVYANNVAMDRLKVWGNYTGGGYINGGAGIGIIGCSNVRVSWSEISDNTAGSVYGEGGGLMLNNAGSDSAPAIVEYCDILRNRSLGMWGYGGGGGGGIYVYANSRLLVANCRLIGNQSMANFEGYTSGSNGREGSAIFNLQFNGTPRVTAFGCLFSQNRSTTGVTQDCATVCNISDDVRAMTLANCTLADDYQGGLKHVSAGSSGQGFTIINSILKCQDAEVNTGQPRLNFQHTSVQVSRYRYEDSAGWHMPDPSNSLLAALSVQDNQPTNRFHSLSAAGVRTQNLEGNVDGDPGFVGPGDPFGKPEYSLVRSSSGTDSALTRSGAGFTYVDINRNGTYDALVDIIVDGTPPGGDHFVYLKDVAGNRRVKGQSLDRGCYEYQPPKGTVVMFK